MHALVAFSHVLAGHFTTSGAAGVIHPFAADRLLPVTRTSTLDQLYLAVGQALDNLIREIGLEVAA
jgi:hypothetical protein